MTALAVVAVLAIIVPAVICGAVGYRLGRARGWIAGYRHRVNQERRALELSATNVHPITRATTPRRR